MDKITVNVHWHDEPAVWVATSEDIWGLAAQAHDLETLQRKVMPMISDLIELNKVAIDGSTVQVHFVAHSTNVLELKHVA